LVFDIVQPFGNIHCRVAPSRFDATLFLEGE